MSKKVAFLTFHAADNYGACKDMMILESSSSILKQSVL